MKREKILVTGANGLLGTNVVVRLLDSGYRVKALVRRPAEFALGPREGLEIVQGDIDQPDTYAGVMQECNSVIHIAAITRQDLTDYRPYRKINVEATENLLTSAIHNQLQNFIYVSSANCFGFGAVDVPGDESSPIRRPFTNSYYARSKLEAQQKVLNHQSEIKTVVVNPTFMLGAYDTKPSSGRIILLGHRKKVIFHPPGGKNFVHVRDVADGILAALEKGRSGEAYLLCGHNLSYREFFRQLSSVSGQRSYYVQVPAFVLKSVGQLGNLLRRMGIANEFTAPNMEALCIENHYTHKKAANELGFSTRPVKEAIRDAIQWFESRDQASG